MRLNLGRQGRLADWTTVDLAAANVLHDLGTFPWPFGAGEAEEIYAGHILEHFDKRGGRLFLMECRRILGQGGAIRLAVPDLDIAVDGLNAGTWNIADPERHRDLNYFLGGSLEREASPAWRHKYLYTFESLKAALEECGFADVQRREFCLDVDNPEHRWISLYVEARRG